MSGENCRMPKRILMTADTVGGVWTYAAELLRALGSYGVKTALATMGPPLTGEQREEAAQVPYIEVYESSFKLEWMDDPWHDVACAGRWLLGIEESFRPDVIHLNGYVHAALPWQSPTLIVGHSCVLSWWEAVFGSSLPGSWSRYRKEVSSGLASADYLVAPSHSMLAALRRNYRETPCGRVILNGRSPGLFEPGEKENFVMTVGRIWDRAKNAAALQAVSSGIEWPVYIAGEEKISDVVDGSGLQESGAVHRLGRLSPHAVAAWLSRASIYALPAYYEPFGLSVLEAGLSGCALVLGDIPSLRELWEDAAVFVPPGNTDALRDALQGLIRDPGCRATMAGRARARARGFTPRRMAEGYIEVYRELLSRREDRKEAACGS